MLISIVEVGFIVSGNVGTGIILAKKKDGSGWSNPSACGLTGLGWGFLVGGSIKDVVVFMMDDGTMENVAGDAGLKFGGQMEVTLGPFGRSAQIDVRVGSGGAGGTIAVAFSKGAFLGLNIEGAVVGARNAANATFYGQPDVVARQILFRDDVVTFPTDKVTLMEEVYAKLEQLSAGATVEPAAEDDAKKSAAKAAADEAAALANQQPDVVQVDASAEASKAST